MSHRQRDNKAFLELLNKRFIEKMKLPRAKYLSSLYEYLFIMHVYRYMAYVGDFKKFYEHARSKTLGGIVYDYVDNVKECSIPEDVMSKDDMYTFAEHVCGFKADIGFSFFGKRVKTKYASDLYENSCSLSFYGMSYMKAFVESLYRWALCTLLIRYESWFANQYGKYRKDNYLYMLKKVKERRREHNLMMKYNEEYAKLYRMVRRYARPSVYGDLKEVYRNAVKAAERNEGAKRVVRYIQDRYGDIDAYVVKAYDKALFLKKTYEETKGKRRKKKS